MRAEQLDRERRGRFAREREHRVEAHGEHFGLAVVDEQLVTQQSRAVGPPEITNALRCSDSRRALRIGEQSREHIERICAREVCVRESTHARSSAAVSSGGGIPSGWMTRSPRTSTRNAVPSDRSSKMIGG